ncbi:MAG: glycosyl transferase family 1 [Rhodospirillales bacterium]|nr:glycosyl transferase family 1 [Rhodospirillales bacterium]
MNYLFIHQNFPGQFQHVVRHLADRPQNRVIFITQANTNEMRGVTKLVYEADQTPAVGVHPFLTEFDQATRNGLSVAELCRGLDAQGFRPDIIVGHIGWGETLFLKDVWPDLPVLGYCEFYYHLVGSDVGFDPEYPAHWIDGPRLRAKNAINQLALEAIDWGQTPTGWQQAQYPAHHRPAISVIHEGVDTDIAKPDPDAWIQLQRTGAKLTAGDEVITFVSRNLEPYRGFHIFMRALPALLKRRPKAQVLIIGADGVSYGRAAPTGTTYREMLLAEMGDRIDFDRVHFLGQVSHGLFINVLQLSAVHVYLTYPFVLSWSFMEAMALGCLVIGSATTPVMEVLQDGHNGLLVDFFDGPGLVDRIDEVLSHPDRMQQLRLNARQTILDQYDLKAVALPAYLSLIDDVAAGRLRHPDRRTG